MPRQYIPSGLVIASGPSVLGQTPAPPRTCGRARCMRTAALPPFWQWASWGGVLAEVRICRKGAAHRLLPRWPPPWRAEGRSVRRSAASIVRTCTTGQGLVPLAGAKRALVARCSGVRAPLPPSDSACHRRRHSRPAGLFRRSDQTRVLLERCRPPPRPLSAGRHSSARWSICTPAPFEARLPC